MVLDPARGGGAAMTAAGELSGRGRARPRTRLRQQPAASAAWSRYERTRESMREELEVDGHSRHEVALLRSRPTTPVRSRSGRAGSGGVAGGEVEGG